MIELREVPDRELLLELRRRKQERWQGHCDYCGRYRTTEPCARRDRHAAAFRAEDFEVI